jgi:hypothetical protein
LLFSILKVVDQLMQEKFVTLVILLFMIFLSCASSEELAANSGPLSSPGPLVLSSLTTSDANAGGRAITASIETAAEMMERTGPELVSTDLDPQTGIIESGQVSDSIQDLFLSNDSGDFGHAVVSEGNPSPGAVTWTSLGGYTAYKHSAIMDDQGRRHVFVIGGDNALWDNVDGSWIGLGGAISSAPYATKDNYGRIHIVVRGQDYALWDFIFDTTSWTGGWRGMGGYLTSMATAAMEPTYGIWMKIVVKGGDNSLWQCDFNVHDLSSYNWIGCGGYLNSWPFVIFDQNSRIHIFAAGGDNSLWDNRGVLSSGEYVLRWHGLGGFIQGAPFSTLEPGYPNFLLAMVRGGDNGLWMADINGLSNPETCTWRGFGGGLTSEAFASTDTSGRVHTFIRGGDGAMWENVFSSNPWNPSGARWVGHGGNIIQSPQALLDGQTYAYVKGGDNAIWRKLYATSVPASSVAEASGKVDSPVEVVTLVEGATGSSKV